MSWDWREGLCSEDHMHSWMLSSEGWQCLAAPRDTPESVDADEATIIESYEWVSVKPPVLKKLTEMIADAKNEMAAELESSVLSELPDEMVGLSPLIDQGKTTFSDLLKLTMDQYDHAIKAETMAWLNSPFYKIMQQRNAEIRLLYGTMTNYFLVMEHKPQPEGAA